MAQTHADITEAFEAFVASIGSGQYYKAHEDIEALWFPRRFEEDDEVRLWKGFINAAVSFELIKRGRPVPSKTAWKNYLKYRALLGTIETSRYPLYVTISQLLETTRQELFPENTHKEYSDVRIFKSDGVSPCVQAV